MWGWQYHIHVGDSPGTSPVRSFERAANHILSPAPMNRAQTEQQAACWCEPQLETLLRIKNLEALLCDQDLEVEQVSDLNTRAR